MPKDELFFLKSPNIHGGHVEVAWNTGTKLETFLKRMTKKHGAKTKWVAQNYVKPLLFEGRKFHIRLFVLITGTDPLKVWMLPRWSYFELAHGNHSIPASGENIGAEQLLREVTNNPFTERERLKDIKADPGRYWKPLEDLQQLGEDVYAHLIGQMKETVATTLVIIAGNLREDALKLRGQRHAFELLGYDVLFDEEKKARILEINRSPSMAAHSEMKRLRKTSMLGDVFCIAGIGCERASLNPGPIPTDEEDDLGESDEQLDAVQCLKREQKRAARTSAVQVLPDKDLVAKFWPVVGESHRYENVRYFHDKDIGQDKRRGEL